MPEGPRLFSWSLVIPGMSGKLQNIFLGFLKDSWIARRSKNIFLKFDKTWNVCQASKYFSMIFKASWIARRSKIIFLKFGNSLNVWQASKYFSMIFKSLLDCQKVQDNFPDIWQVLECFTSFKIFFYDFLKVSWISRGSKITFLMFD